MIKKEIIIFAIIFGISFVSYGLFLYVQDWKFTVAFVGGGLAGTIAMATRAEY